MMGINSLYIPQPVQSNIGGPTTFLKNLHSYARRESIPINENIGDSQVIFFPISASVPELLKARKRKAKLIQRLDGLYHFQRNGISYFKKNLKIAFIYYFLSNYKIFQSQYSKRQCEYMFSEVQKTPVRLEGETIICNGADENIFFPASHVVERQLQGPVQLITTGSFRHLDMLKPIVDALDELKGFDFQLHVVGPILIPELNEYLKRPYIQYHGPQSLQSTASLLREKHIFLFSALNPACPNNVVEAISTSLPVVSFDTGAAKELCSFAPELMAITENKVMHSVRDLDPAEFKKCVVKCIDNYKYYSNLAIQHSKDYTLEKMGRRYFDFFREVSLS